jgi:ubiquinone/menaquinone biosynthesis C-methylase UbiE
MKDVKFKEDLQNLSFKDNSYDIILNNHVLEHISNDKKAIQEIQRILKPDGIAIITVPGDWKKRTKHFFSLDNNGHYRDYGFDFVFKLKKVFKRVHIQKLFKYQGQKHAIKKDEIAFICFK